MIRHEAVGEESESPLLADLQEAVNDALCQVLIGERSLPVVTEGRESADGHEENVVWVRVIETLQALAPTVKARHKSLPISPCSGGALYPPLGITPAAPALFGRVPSPDPTHLG